MGAHELDWPAGPRSIRLSCDAARIAQHFDSTVDTAFAHDGTIREKYNVVSGNANVHVTSRVQGKRDRLRYGPTRSISR